MHDDDDDDDDDGNILSRKLLLTVIVAGAKNPSTVAAASKVVQIHGRIISRELCLPIEADMFRYDYIDSYHTREGGTRVGRGRFLDPWKTKRELGQNKGDAKTAQNPSSYFPSLLVSNATEKGPNATPRHGHMLLGHDSRRIRYLGIRTATVCSPGTKKKRK